MCRSVFLFVARALPRPRDRVLMRRAWVDVGWLRLGKLSAPRARAARRVDKQVRNALVWGDKGRSQFLSLAFCRYSPSTAVSVRARAGMTADKVRPRKAPHRETSRGPACDFEAVVAGAGGAIARHSCTGRLCLTENFWRAAKLDAASMSSGGKSIAQVWYFFIVIILSG
jgi:hypothetical protein